LLPSYAAEAARELVMESDPFSTQRGVGTDVVAELGAAGFDDAVVIGRGGFGIVYRCTQVAVDRTVAVKVLTADLDEDRERFLREQRAMGRLTGHPNVVGVLQVGETESGYPYLVMQYHRRGSLEARIRRLGHLALDEVLRLGVRIAGALESAHRLNIVHRDVKPGNILITDYGEPALSDFGIAQMAEGFKTAAGTFAGSPAFTAPEILSGDPPSRASDVYGLGATLFSALTGHAAFERRSGEQVVAQFLRIANESAPDLRASGIPDDVSAVVDKAMCRDRDSRPSPLELGDELARVQANHGFPVDQMAFCAAKQDGQPARRAAVTAGAYRTLGNLPQDLTSFVGRRAELGDLKGLLATSRLVTLTGIGGVGKTRLALRVANELRHDFADGVWFVELGEVRDDSLLVGVLAATFHLRDQSATALQDVLFDFLRARELLLVLDNCEQVVDSAAKLTEALLRASPELRILATSREALGIGAETVMALAPLSVADVDTMPTLRGLRGYDAVALFAERAAAAVPGFTLTADNRETVARICFRLDGLPLGIELAAARLRAMSPEQILERLSDRYALLTRGSRGAPPRQQTLEWSVGWSYDLCTPAEQQLWNQLSVFAGSFELEAAENVCGEELSPADLLDLLSSLVDKSILIRTESRGVVRFRLLDTLRAYGRHRIQQTGEYQKLRRRHRDWYLRLVIEAEGEWFGSRQIYWLERLEREMPNLREALEFGLSDSVEPALRIAAALHPTWIAHGMLSEGRRWLDRALAATPPTPTMERVKALYGASTIGGLQGDLPAQTARVVEARELVEQMTDPLANGLLNLADGFKWLLSGGFDQACACFDEALRASDEPVVRVTAMAWMGWALEFRGDTAEALSWQERALALAESVGESVYRSYVLWSVGILTWRHGELDRAARLLTECLNLAHRLNDPRNGAACLEALAWIAGARNNLRTAVVLMASAEALGHAVGAPPAVFPNLSVSHDEWERRAREELKAKAFEAARQEGSSLNFDEATAYALEQSQP
jgi:predicted ATPase